MSLLQLMISSKRRRIKVSCRFLSSSTFIIPHYRNNVSSRISVLIPKTEDEVNEFIDSLKSEHFVGLDIEWPPSFGKGRKSKVSLLQIANSHRAMLLQFSKFHRNPHSLVDFLLSDILKVGVGVEQDLKTLETDFGLKYSGFVDVGYSAKRMRENISQFSLSFLVQHYFNETLEKPHFIRMSDWGKQTLTDSQIKYATYDAVISNDIYQELFNEGAYDPTKIQVLIEEISSNVFEKGRSTFRKYYQDACESDFVLMAVSKRLQQREFTTCPSSSSDSLMDYLSRFGLSASFDCRQNYNPSRKVHEVTVNVIIQGKTVATETDQSKREAKNKACWKVLQNLMVVQRNLPATNLLAVYAGYDATPTEFLKYFQNPSYYDELISK